MKDPGRSRRASVKGTSPGSCLLGTSHTTESEGRAEGGEGEGRGAKQGRAGEGGKGREARNRV